MSTTTNSKVIPHRLKSLDALRGFDMFWIIVGSKFVHVLVAAAGWSWLQGMDKRLSHPDWNGFRAFDLIFLCSYLWLGYPRLFCWTAGWKKSSIVGV